MKLLDQHGQPIATEATAQPQTARLVQLKRELAGHPTRGLTPARLNQILEAAEHGDIIEQHELFADMEQRDGHLFSELSKRRRSIVRLPWQVKPPRNASKAEQAQATFVQELLLDFTEFEGLIFDALDAIGHGFAALELEWGRIGAQWTIKSATHRPQSWFRLDWDTRSQILLRNGGTGEPLWPLGWALHQHKAVSGYAATSGLFRVLVWPYLFKHFAVGDLAEFLDIYGLPIRIGKYPSNTTNDAEKATLWQAVAGIGHNAAGIIPASMSIELTEAAKGSEKPFEAMMAWCERTQSKAVLGSTLTSDAGATGLGSGLAEIHNAVRLEIRDSDCKQLAATLTRDLVYPLLALNSNSPVDARRMPRFEFDTSEPEDLEKYAKALPELVKVGAQIPVNWVQQKLGIPVPQEGEAVLRVVLPESKAAPTQPSDPKNAPQSDKKTAAALRQSLALNVLSQSVAAALKAQNPKASSPYADQEAIDGALEQLSAEMQLQAEQWLQPALDALKAAGSPDDALALLSNANPLVTDEVLAQAVAQALFVAELVGADGVLQELPDGT